MPLLLVLCLALLRALAPVLTSPVARVHHARVEQRVPSERSAPSVPSVPREAAHAAVPERGEVAPSGERSDGGAPPSPAPVAAPCLPSGATFAAAVRARTLEASHAVAARGALLPYFPTAPPRPS